MFFARTILNIKIGSVRRIQSFIVLKLVVHIVITWLKNVKLGATSEHLTGMTEEYLINSRYGKPVYRSKLETWTSLL
jgi:hypothetical protein